MIPQSHSTLPSHCTELLKLIGKDQSATKRKQDGRSEETRFTAVLPATGRTTNSVGGTASTKVS